jgi:hypothetical protein
MSEVCVEMLELAAGVLNERRNRKDENVMLCLGTMGSNYVTE